MTLEALAAKVKHLEDVQEITNVLIAYGRALDSRDFKAYSSLFAKDGSWSGGMGSVSGGPQTVHRGGLFTAANTTAAGVLVFETVANVDAIVTTSDSLVATWTVTLSG